MDFFPKSEPVKGYVLAALVSAIAVCLLIVVADYLYGWSIRKQLGDIPIVGDNSDVCSLLQRRSAEGDLVKETTQAYQQYTKNGLPWAIRPLNRFYWICLPPQSAREWSYLPQDHLNFIKLVEKENMHHRHSNLASPTVANALLKCNKKPYLDAFSYMVGSQVDQLIPSAFPVSPGEKGWQVINVWERLYYVLSRVMIACILGPEFASDQKLLELYVSYNSLITSHTSTCVRFPRPLHSLVSRFAPTNRKLRTVMKELKSRLIPEIRCQVCRLRSEKSQNRSCSLLDAVIEECMAENTIGRETRHFDEEKQISQIADKIMFLHFESALPVTMAVTTIIYRIMVNPECVAPLREELQAALPTGQCTTPDVMNQCPKLESFMRENQRLHGSSLYCSSRLVIKPVHIPSLGRTFPAGSILTLPWYWMARDPDLYPNPDRFDSNRFYDASSGGCTARLTTTSDKFLGFGYGAVTCPGRFLTSRLIQTVFAKILLDFDVTCMPSRQEFPFNTLSSSFSMPNSEIEARIRPRAGKM
ncbi:cytochrome P450 [Aspergillus candidus]|uniref:Cytochrome P450 n=1 Tax=Aspergillus candidus TaxID=41067 RepID=A0A2I2F239_ASPCN|nr:cytochrome P450 [Aspergillus candidus]PLB34668.1 cytochrome P450 [Aspergillus candidus]